MLAYASTEVTLPSAARTPQTLGSLRQIGQVWAFQWCHQSVHGHSLTCLLIKQLNWAQNLTLSIPYFIHRPPFLTVL